MPDDMPEAQNTPLTDENVNQTTESINTPADTYQAARTPQAMSQPAQTAVYSETMPATKKSRSLSKAIIIIGIALLLLGAGAYGYFGVYTQSPENIWKQALKNTSEGLKKFAEQPKPAFKGGKLDGSFKLDSPVASDGTFSGEYYDKSAKLSASVGALGTRANLELRSIVPENSTTPDVYFKADGLGSVIPLVGGATSDIGVLLKAVENKWFVVDHTLLDQATASNTSVQKITQTPEEIAKEVQDLSKKIAVVLDDRLFSTDDSKAVLEIKEKLAKEDFKGRNSQHLKVQVRKQQLRDMTIALKDTVKESKVKDWLTSGQTGKTFEEAIDFDGLLKEIDNAKYDKAVADVWVDMDLKYIRNVRISNSPDGDSSSGTIDFMLDYVGGDNFPFLITLTTKDGSNDAVVKVGFSINQKSFVTKFTIGVEGMYDGKKAQGSAELTLTPSDDKISIDKPAGAQNIMELFGDYSGQLQNLQSMSDNLDTASQAQSIIDAIQAQ